MGKGLAGLRTEGHVYLAKNKEKGGWGGGRSASIAIYLNKKGDPSV